MSNFSPRMTFAQRRAHRDAWKTVSEICVVAGIVSAGIAVLAFGYLAAYAGALTVGATPTPTDLRAVTVTVWALGLSGAVLVPALLGFIYSNIRKEGY